MKRAIVLFFFFTIFVISASGIYVSDVFASCSCECVGGRVVPICSSSLDIRPICPPRICPITPPSIAPITPPRVPPIGTTNCRQMQIYNPRTGQYEWKEVCY